MSSQRHQLQGDTEELHRLENIEGRIEYLLASLNIMENLINGLYTRTEVCSTQQDEMVSKINQVRKQLELIKNLLMKVLLSTMNTLVN